MQGPLQRFRIDPAKNMVTMAGQFVTDLVLLKQSSPVETIDPRIIRRYQMSNHKS